MKYAGTYIDLFYDPDWSAHLILTTDGVYQNTLDRVDQKIRMDSEQYYARKEELRSKEQPCQR